MKVIVYLSIAASTIWSYIAFPFNLTSPIAMLINLYKYQLPSVTWIVACIYFLDFIMATLRKSSPYMIEFYSGVRIEFISLASLFIFTLLLYNLSSMRFTNAAIDISMAGFGFLVFGNIGTFRLFTYKVGSRSYPKKVAFLFSLFSVSTSSYFLYLTFKVANGEYNIVQSLWVQITVLSYSITLYFFAKQLCFFMDKGRVEASPILLSILKKVRRKNNLYEQMASGTTLFNQELIKERAIHSRKLRRRHKSDKK
ncbi:hypothetical protein ACFJ30_003779 [Salmonella enterica]|nr:hypothetical protein [Salmonella enterica]